MTEYNHESTYDFAKMSDAELHKLFAAMESYGKEKGVIGKSGVEPIAKDATHDSIVETVTNVHNYICVRLTKVPTQVAPKSKSKKTEQSAPKEAKEQKPQTKSAQQPTKSKGQETEEMTKTSKTTAKKAAKKAAKKSASNKARTPVARGTYKPEQKITVKLKENPCRKGTQQHEFIAKLMKFNGKTVGDFYKAGGASHTVKRAAEADWIKVA